MTLEPAGTVEFDHVPENVYTGLPIRTDMAVAAGHGRRDHYRFTDRSNDPLQTVAAVLCAVPGRG
ncbi:hypothetical protein C8039_18650 [Halogeometricum sp. wsp3]|nr:hypothetical protein C8039_18650 [Halogeometricum sp. wsp3]